MRIKTLIGVMALGATSLFAQEKEVVLKTGIHLENMNLSVRPGDDFYRFATEGWRKNHPLTPEYSRFGSFDVLQENNIKRLCTLIEDAASTQHPVGSVEQKIADLYKAAMDSTYQEQHGMEDLKAFLALDGYARSRQGAKAWNETIWPRIMRQGARGLFRFTIGADERNSKNNILYIMQGGLTLGQRDYYLEKDPATTRIREAYVAYIKAQSQNLGFTKKQAGRMAVDVMRIETCLAKASKSMSEMRNPEANYNKMTFAELQKSFPSIDWTSYFANFGVCGVKEVVVGQPKAIAEAERILRCEKPEALQNLYLWHALNLAADFVNDSSRQLSFGFWGTTMSGRTQDRPRWKRAVASVEDGLGEALGQIYVAKYFPPAAKTRMEQLVKGLQIALGQRIDEQEWMTSETKKVAREKLDAFYVKVGYPNKWKDYSALKIGTSYLQNFLACNEWGLNDMVQSHLNKPVDKDEWFMTPQTVNAYYNPTTNEICFPAGILQPPFFDMTADDAFNYGAIGVVIGHEMTHGFDDQGSKYDKDGNLKVWWTEADTQRFVERIQVMRDFHSQIEILPGLYSNGQLTLGENTADHGGLMVAYQAFKAVTKDHPLPTVDGFTPDQRFFLAYANVWAQNIREEEIRKRVKSDVHQLGEWRVNGQMPHLAAWYEAFGIKEGDKMYIPEAKRVHVW